MNKLKILKDFKNGRVGIYTEKTIHDKIEFRLLLNILIATQFNLKPYMTAEGGVEDERVKLKNDTGLIIGLQKDIEIDRRVTREETEILYWYAEVIEILFIKGSIGKIMPNLLWLSKKYKNNYNERISLLMDAIIHSDWSFLDKKNTLEERIDFYTKTYLKSIKSFLTKHLYFDEFLPLKERGLYLGRIKQL